MRTEFIQTAVLLLSSSVGAGISTDTFQSPVPLTSNGVPIDLGSHAAPRIVDWESDGISDLLVADGQGYIWLFPKRVGMSQFDFGTGTKVRAGVTEIRVGSGFAGACLVDVNSDGRRDLVVSGSDRKVYWFQNVQSPWSPLLAPAVQLPSTNGTFELPIWTGGRIDVADWDGDGRQDLLAGHFEGGVFWYRNVGTPSSPVLDPVARRISSNGTFIGYAYNTHPRALDLNGDGLLDLVFGNNWGEFLMGLGRAPQGSTDIGVLTSLKDPEGSTISVRALNNDDSIPDLADLDGDGVVDLVTGGLNGKLFVLAGVDPVAESKSEIIRIMDDSLTDFTIQLASSEQFRSRIFELHRRIRRSLEFLGPEDRSAVFDWYLSLFARYPDLLQRRHFDTLTEPFLASLAGQVWINTLEAGKDDLLSRTRMANSAHFVGMDRALLIELGVIYIDNNAALDASRHAIFDLVSSIPAELQTVRCITNFDRLRSPNGDLVCPESSNGINVFADVGMYWEGFPPEVSETHIDGFCAVVVHELNHNVEHAAARRDPEFQRRKMELLKQASPPHIRFMPPPSLPSVDWAATQTVFRDAGLWNGDTTDWWNAYDRYWSVGGAVGFNRRWLRDNLNFCLQAPQEAFATLSNQYFTSSVTMLELAIVRWNEGISNCIDQFLLFVDVYALGSNQTTLYRVDSSARVLQAPALLKRDSVGRIIQLSHANERVVFHRDATGSVIRIERAGACASDLDLDAIVDNGDLALALLDFGPCSNCASDRDLDGKVDFGDLALILLEFGPCP